MIKFKEFGIKWDRLVDEISYTRNLEKTYPLGNFEITAQYFITSKVLKTALRLKNKKKILWSKKITVSDVREWNKQAWEEVLKELNFKKLELTRQLGG